MKESNIKVISEVAQSKTASSKIARLNKIAEEYREASEAEIETTIRAEKAMSASRTPFQFSEAKALADELTAVHAKRVKESGEKLVDCFSKIGMEVSYDGRSGEYYAARNGNRKVWRILVTRKMEAVMEVCAEDESDAIESAKGLFSLKANGSTALVSVQTEAVGRRVIRIV